MIYYSTFFDILKLLDVIICVNFIECILKSVLKVFAFAWSLSRKSSFYAEIKENCIIFVKYLIFTSYDDFDFILAISTSTIENSKICN